MRRTFLVFLAALAVPTASATSLLTGGDVDDHLNWDHYVRYTERTADGQQTGSGLPGLGVADRVMFLVQNEDGEPLPWAQASIRPVNASEPFAEFAVGVDGRLAFFPSHDGFGSAEHFEVRVEAAGGNATASVNLSQLPANRTVTLTVPGAEPSPPASLDLMMVIDTTGSMSDELRFLTAELESIVAQIVAAHAGVDVRLGLTVYRDHGDAYVVRPLGFTSSVDEMKSWLANQSADGGGDYPEAMDEALAAALGAQWRSGTTARILLLVADAPTHAEGYAPFLDAAADARAQGVRLHGLAASGVAQEAEYLMRAAAVLTQGRYMFLTDDSGIGNPHAEPSIPCYVVTTLDDLLVRVVASDLSGERVEPDGQDVIRSVGEYERGVCLAAEGEEQQTDPGGAPGGESGPAPAVGAPPAAPPAASTSGPGDSDATGRFPIDGGDGDGGEEPGPADPPSSSTPGVGWVGAAAAVAVGAALWRRRRP